MKTPVYHNSLSEAQALFKLKVKWKDPYLCLGCDPFAYVTETLCLIFCERSFQKVNWMEKASNISQNTPFWTVTKEINFELEEAPIG